MKKNIIMLVILSFIYCASCDKFLEEHNEGAVSVEGGYYKTAPGIQALVNSCYSPLRLWAGKGLANNISELGTDITIACEGDNFGVYNSGLNSADNTLSSYFKWYYAAINYCNIAIANIPNIAEMSAIQKSKIEGEVRMLRAFYYWVLVETFGDIYYTDTPSSGVVNNPTKKSVAEIYVKIFDDLDFAIGSSLSENRTDNGHITKWAAKAFKARLLLTRATETNNQDLYSQAYDLAKDVIDNSGCILNSNYSNIWLMANNDGQKNSEAVWYVDYDINSTYDGDLGPIEKNYALIRNGGNNNHLLWIMVYDNQPGLTRSIEYGRPFCMMMPTRYCLNLFDEQKDQRFAASFRQVWKRNTDVPTSYPLMTDTAIFCVKGVATSAQRSRADQRYKILDFNDIYFPEGAVNNAQQFIALKKFEDPTRGSISEDKSSRDFYLIRISEMYLIVAEAGAKTSKPDALTYMNTLRRTRAILGHENEMEVTQSDINNIDFILEEHAREFIGEQLRWFFLKRLGAAKFVSQIKKGNPDAANVQDYNILRPYPQSFLDAISNKEEFSQHIGYH